MPTDIKQHIKGEVTFLQFSKGNLWYKTDTNFVFPVPVSECDSGVFLAKDRAMPFMRYIRKQMEDDGSSSLPT